MRDQLTNGQVSADFGSYSGDPTRADYACPAYLEMLPRWQLVKDIRGGTIDIRNRKEVYLPKFDAESETDWAARIAQTFVEDHYATTLEEHVGLVHSTPIKLNDDVPQQIVDLCEDIDGEGNHIQVKATSDFDAALHWGHVALLTEYPVAQAIQTLEDERRVGARPYVVTYEAPDILNWRTAVVGGQQTIVMIMLRERSQVTSGEFGSKTVTRFREVQQEVFYDQITGRVTGVGAVTWRLFEKDGENAPTFKDGGPVTGPKGKNLARIPVRVIYGGVKLGVLHTRPHLLGLAYSNVEHTQVTSDYAAVMHKCNVPTPVFKGRIGAGDGVAVKLGEGVDISTDGDAKFMEPTGVALASTRVRLMDIRDRMAKQGATSEEDKSHMTAAQARLIAKVRNAKLLRSARSEQDAYEGVLADFAAFMGIAPPADSVKSGGSIVVNTNFSGEDLDPTYLTVLVTAYTAGAFPLEALLFALKTGKLPDEFSAEQEALKLAAAEQAKAKQERDLLQQQQTGKKAVVRDAKGNVTHTVGGA